MGRDVLNTQNPSDCLCICEPCTSTPTHDENNAAITHNSSAPSFRFGVAEKVLPVRKHLVLFFARPHPHLGDITAQPPTKTKPRKEMEDTHDQILNHTSTAVLVVCVHQQAAEPPPPHLLQKIKQAPRFRLLLLLLLTSCRMSCPVDERFEGTR